MPDSLPTPILSKPGIQRDGTRLAKNAYVDGRWVRFVNGQPRKMLGYNLLSGGLSGISRGLHTASVDGVTHFHSGHGSGLDLVRVTSRAINQIIEPANRTPSAFAVSSDNVWSFDAMQDVIDGEWKLIAHAAPNGADIDSSVEGAVYIGPLNSDTALVPIMDGADPLKVSGGIACIHPFLFAFGNDGEMIWSVSNKPSDVVSTFNTGTNVPAGEARPTGKKVLAGRPWRGTVPTGLFWSMDTLLRGTYVGGAATWDFDPISGIEIISPRSIVEYNGAYMWVGARRFCVFAGQVQDIPNTYNLDYFFDNLNWAYAARIFGFANPARGEVWWCFPKGDATECTHAVILHVPSGIWYDTPLPGAGDLQGRTAGVGPTSTYPYPVLAGLGEGDVHSLWQHEVGYDEVEAGSSRAVKSYFVTSDISFLRQQEPKGDSVEVLSIEPDFVQRKHLTVTVIGNANARAPEDAGDAVRIEEPVDDLPPEQQIIELRGEHRQLRFKFESNAQGGYYEAGATYAEIKPTSGRTTT